jgi:RHS repeat-associated protein
LSYTYDSSLPKSVIWSGEVNGTVSVEYDNNMRVTTQSINDGNTVSFQYDQDGLLTQAGEMTITREPETGRISGTTLGNVTTSQGYNSLGELTSYEAKYNGNPIFQTSYTRDSLGRITQLLETVQGQQKEMSYAYDVAGRLWKVWRNDTLISMYSYDPNGNRIAHITLTSVDSGVYDAQDRLLHYSNSQYLFTLNGELRMKIESTDTTHYIYDYFGNLVTVVLPDKDRIDYIIDGQNRRIGKKVNGRVVKRWIYSRQLSPVAELDSSGNVVAQFVGNFLIKNNTIYQLITDHLGSVRLVINVESGEIVERTDYDEYGNILERSEISTWSGQPFAYAGGLYDQQTKLVRFGFRDYEAETGRWTCKDPIGFIGGMNLYNYVAGNAVNKTDQFGLLSSYWHYAISYSAAKTAGFSDQAAEYIAQAAVAADNGTQGPSPEMNAVHATIGKDPSTGNFQSPEQAYSNTVTFVKSQLAFANKFKQEGNCLGYYQAIGFALHPAQDQWAGGHSYTPFRGYLNPSIVPHAAMDYFPSEATLNAALFSSLQILEGNLQSALPPIK